MKCHRRPARQRGAATMVVVMVMFLVLALMAVYANRNLIFEQRIASNQVRSGQALEMAEAGVEWTLAQLNGRNIDGACAAAAGGISFRKRYLVQDPGTRAVTLQPALVQASASTKPAASCVRTSSSGWACQCPNAGGWADTAQSASDDVQPSFGIRFETIGRPGVLRVASFGCTGSSLGVCSGDFATATDQLLSNVLVRTEIALLSALKTPPIAPLVLRGGLEPGDLGLHNSDPRSGGLLMISGSALPTLAGNRLESLPGSPGNLALIGNDATLQATASSDAMFKLFFGMPPGKYRTQPALRLLDCTGDCSAALLDAYASGVRMVWVTGPLTLSSNITLGSSSDPLLVVADGPVTLNGPLNFNGLLYARGNVSWANASALPAVLSGALISEGSVTIIGHVDLWYRGEVMDTLSNIAGSFVRVPASWLDSIGT